MKEMTSKERVQAVLQGKVPDRLPIVPQSFMFAAHTAGYSIGQINRSPQKMAQSHILSQEKYGYDGCVIDVDDATLAEACGARVNFRDDNVAAVDENHPLLEDIQDIHQLKKPDPYKDGRMGEWLETTQRLVQAIGDRVWVMGRSDQGPFDLLCLLRGTENFMVDLLTEDADAICAALDWCADVHICFCLAQKAAGAHATSMGDAYASPNLVSPKIYRQFAFDPEVKVVNAVQTPDFPYSIHICGDTTAIVEDMGKTGAKLLEIDWKSDMAKARASVSQQTVLMGNINPSDPLVFGTPEAVDAQAKNIIQSTKGKGIILSSGCAMGANTKPENMMALVGATKKYATYEQLVELQK